MFFFWRNSEKSFDSLIFSKNEWVEAFLVKIGPKNESKRMSRTKRFDSFKKWPNFWKNEWVEMSRNESKWVEAFFWNLNVFWKCLKKIIKVSFFLTVFFCGTAFCTKWNSFYFNQQPDFFPSARHGCNLSLRLPWRHTHVWELSVSPNKARHKHDYQLQVLFVGQRTFVRSGYVEMFLSKLIRTNCSSTPSRVL